MRAYLQEARHRMSFSDPDPQDDENEEESPKGLRRQLAQQAAENKRLQEELASRDRDLAFTRVGLPETPMAAFFRDNYDGDSSEDAIRTRAAELGLIGSPTAQTTEQVEAIDQMSDAAGGGGFVMPQDQLEAMHAEMRAVRPGPRYGEELELISQKYGMPTRLDDT